LRQNQQGKTICFACIIGLTAENARPTPLWKGLIPSLLAVFAVDWRFTVLGVFGAARSADPKTIPLQTDSRVGGIVGATRPDACGWFPSLKWLGIATQDSICGAFGLRLG